MGQSVSLEGHPVHQLSVSSSFNGQASNRRISIFVSHQFAQWVDAQEKKLKPKVDVLTFGRFVLKSFFASLLDVLSTEQTLERRFWFSPPPTEKPVQVRSWSVFSRHGEDRLSSWKTTLLHILSIDCWSNSFGWLAHRHCASLVKFPLIAKVKPLIAIFLPVPKGSLQKTNYDLFLVFRAFVFSMIQPRRLASPNFFFFYSHTLHLH